jgi:hypothetical protein
MERRILNGVVGARRNADWCAGFGEPPLLVVEVQGNRQLLLDQLDELVRARQAVALVASATWLKRLGVWRNGLPGQYKPPEGMV